MIGDIKQRIKTPDYSTIKSNKSIVVTLILLIIIIASVIGFSVNKSQKLDTQAILSLQLPISAEIDVLNKVYVLQNDGTILITDQQNSVIGDIKLDDPGNITDFSLDQSYAFSSEKERGLEIVTLDSKNNMIKQYSNSGKLVNSFSSNNAIAISTGLHGNIFSIDNNSNLYIFDRLGNTITTKLLEIEKPIDLTIDWLGNIYIGTQDGKVYELDEHLNTRNVVETNVDRIDKIYVNSANNVFTKAGYKINEIDRSKGNIISEQVIPKGTLLATQRFGTVSENTLNSTPQKYLEAFDLHHSINSDQTSSGENESTILDFNTLQQNKLINNYLLNGDKNYKAAYIVSASKRLMGNPSVNLLGIKPNKSVTKICFKKPPIYQTEEEIPEELRNEWPRKTYPGTSEIIYLSAKEGNQYGTGADQSSGIYTLHVGIESEKWDILLENGICPPMWIKENLVDKLNEMLENAKDANNQPVKTKVVMISWDIYDRHYFANWATWINYVPPWFPTTTINTGRDIKWLVRPSANEVSPDEREKMNIFGSVRPNTAAVDVPCEIGDLYCWGAVLHETGHVMELSDLYWWDMYSGENLVNGFPHSTNFHLDIMSNPTYYAFSSYSASNLNIIYDVRVSGIYSSKLNHTAWGTFYRSNRYSEIPYAFIFHYLPQTTRFILYKPDGTLLKNASVEIVPSNKRCASGSGSQCDPDFDLYHSQFFKDDSLSQNAYILLSEVAGEQQIANVTDSKGSIAVDTALLTRRDKNGYFAYTIKPERAINFLIIAKDPTNNLPYYSIVEITELNLAYYKGQTDVADIPVTMQVALKVARRKI